MAQDSTTPTVEVIETRLLKLDLASGQKPIEGFEGVDLYHGDHRVDLLTFPWPWADGSVGEVHCSHFVEHIPMAYVDADGKEHARGGPGRRDMFCAFFDELHRVLKPGGKAKIVVPYLRNARAFQDPTHRRFICEESFLYLNADWRKANGLDHYLGACHFSFNCCRVVDPVWGTRAPEVLAQAMSEKWNVVSDLVVDMVKM